jgi:hypothetical protein
VSPRRKAATDLVELTVEQLLDRYANALVVAVTNGFSHESHESTDARVKAARDELLKRLKKIAREESRAVREAEDRVRVLERRLARIGRIAIEAEEAA